MADIDNLKDDELEAGGAAVTVEIAPDEPTQKGAVTVPDQATEIEDLKRQTEQAKTDAAEARRREAEARRDAQEARTESRDSTLVAISNAIEKQNRDLESMEERLAELHAAGNYREAAKLQREIVKAEGQVSKLEDNRVIVETRMNTGDRPVVTEGRVPTRQPSAPASLDDQVEELCQRLTPKSSEWLRSHKDAMRDPSGLAATHEYAVKRKGLVVDTPAYFAFLESELGFAPRTEAAPSRAAAAPSRSATFDAPVGRDAPSMASGQPRSRVVQLSKAQLEIAEAMDMKPEEYAKYLLEEERERSGMTH